MGQALLAWSAHGYSITLAWDPNPEPEVVKYRVYYGERRGEHPTKVEAGAATQVKIDGLLEGHRYYFVATACTADDLESVPSNEVAFGKGLPVAVDDDLVVRQGEETSVLSDGASSVLSNDISVSGGMLSAFLAEPPRHGRIKLRPDGFFVYRHDGGQSTQDSFVYTVTEGELRSLEATGRVTVLKTTRLNLRGDEFDLGFTSKKEVAWRIRGGLRPFVGNGGFTWVGPQEGPGGEVLLPLRDAWGGVFFRWEHETPHGILEGPLLGLVRLPVSPGMQFLSVPLHPSPLYRGVVAAVEPGSVLLDGAHLSPSSFAPVDGRVQCILVCLPGAGSPGGDWWPVLGNSPDRCWVDDRGRPLDVNLETGRRVEIRPLLSLEDLFGPGGSAPDLVLNADNDLRPSPEEEDLIQFVEPGEPPITFFWHDGSLAEQGCYSLESSTLLGPLDPSTIRLKPGQVFVLRRKAGEGTLAVLGEVQTDPLACYLDSGVTFFGSHFPMTLALSASGLLETGWRRGDNLLPWPGEEDYIAPLAATGVGALLFYHGGGRAAPGWYCRAGGMPRPVDALLEPGLGYLALVHGSEIRTRWLQWPPFPWR